LLSDLDGDGRTDLAAGVGRTLELWRGRDAGVFEPYATLDSGGGASTLLVGVDWNGDGIRDLVFGGSNLRYRLGRGDGTFDAEVACGLALDGNLIASTAVIGDLDRDGRLDLVVHRTGILSGLDGCNASTISPIANWDVNGQQSVVLADLDGDDNLDMIADTRMGSGFEVWVGNGKGGFAQPLSLAGGDWPAYSGVFLVGDLNRDTKLDLLLVRPDGWRVLLNTCK
jgi:hypothetical protein